MNGLKLSIANPSGWPDWFVRPVCDWIVRRAGINWSYRIELPNVAQRWQRAARGWSYGQRSRIHRRYVGRSPVNGPNGRPVFRPYEEKYHRYRWAPKFRVETRLEAFIHLIAHEAAHATIGNPSKWRRPDGRTNAAGMEMACENFAKETVAAWRDPKVRRPIWEKVKRGARTEKHRKKKAVAFRAAAKSDAGKMSRAQAKIQEWTRKAKRADKRLKFWTRKERYYREKIELKARVY